MYQEFYCIYCSKQLNDLKKLVCQDCQKSQGDTDYSISNTKPLQQGQCLQCTFKNEIDAIQCKMCQYVFQQRLDKKDFESKIRKEKSIIKCKNCELENDISNEYCLNCQNELFQHTKKNCLICGFSVREDNYEKHYQECLLSKSLIEEEQLLQKIQPPKPQIKPQIKKPLASLSRLDSGSEKKPNIFNRNKENEKLKFGFIKVNYNGKPFCYYCYKKFQPSEFAQHQKSCIKKQEWTNHISSEDFRMTSLQIKAMMYMHNKCAKQHLDLKNQLQERVQKLGFTNQDLENLQFYIENYAPIIIQIHVSKHMEFFLKDTHYRSQFQTNKSSGSLSRASRIQWEDRMFDKKYSAAKDFERVKYGVINFTNDPKGVNCAKTYGPSYFLLKSHVRDRCTFTDKDSSGNDASIATLKFSFKVVSKMNDQQLKAAFKASKALEQSSGVLITYKQLQIHGPVEFAKDIQRIYVSREQIKSDKRFLDMVYEFSDKFKVQHDFI